MSTITHRGKVNYNKSTVFCRDEENDHISSEVSAVFGMRSSRDLGKYLGLPSIWGRSKMEALSFLHTRISNKIQGWRLKLLNAGKEVLIKAVIKAIRRT